jgi:phage terminase large subunit-like protein
VSRRKAIDEKRGHLTAGDVSVRQKQESKVFELGYPATPTYLWNNRPLWAIWKRYSKWLFGKRLLAYSDGAALLELCEAELAGQKERKKDILNRTWKRQPFPEPIIAGNSLAAFIAKIKAERASFQDRRRPDQTLCLDSLGIEYDWPEDDAATVARRFAQASIENADSGVLVKYAAKRFLNDLESGHTRGVYFDSVAVRNVVEFARTFGGLPEILPWEVWVLAAIFGFKRATGFRVVTEAWLSVGRENGKTRFAATVGLFLLVCDLEKYAEVYVCATAKEQSRICWRDARRVVSDSAELIAHVTRWAGELHVKDADSKMQALASEERSFLGVRASAVIADEVGVWEGRDAWDAIVQSTVSRTQPLTLAITTAPAHKMTFAFEKFSWAERILRGIVQADHVFAAIFRIDDGDDPKDIVKLRKANPSLGTILPEDHIAKQIAELSDTPSGLNNFLQFHANVTPELTLQRAGSIVAAKWDACAGLELIGETDSRKAVEKFLALNRDVPCFAGLDYGAIDDLTCLALTWPRARFVEGGDLVERKIVIVQGFMPEVGILEKEKSWGVPLSTWAREGWIELLPGDMVDPELVRDYILKCCSFLRIRELGFDSWGIPSTMAKLNESGAVKCVAVSQVAKETTAPCRELLLWINRRDLVHFANPVLSWMAGNVVLEESKTHGGIKPDRLSAKEKIDFIAATVNAIHRQLAAPPPSVYLERGVITL